MIFEVNVFFFGEGAGGGAGLTRVWGFDKESKKNIYI